MTFQTLMYILMNFTFYAFFITMAIIFGIQPSISNNWYVLRERNQERWFSYVTLAYGLFAFLTYPHWFTGLSFIGLIAVAFAPNFREVTKGGTKMFGSLEEEIHKSGAMTTVLVSQIFIYLTLQLHYISILSLSSVLVYKYLSKGHQSMITNETTWVEFIMFTSLSLAYLIKIYF